MAEKKTNKNAEVAEEVVETKVETEATEAEPTKAPEAKPTRPTKQYVEIRIPRDPLGKSDSIFVGVNFKNYILKRGTTVRVPIEVAEVLKNSELAEDAAIAFAQAKEEEYFEKSKNHA